MLILGADTSGKNGSIALVRCEAGECRTLGTASLEGGTFSAQLVPQIAELLSKHSLTKRDIEGFAVVSGPGSFTGLRVGLAAIKGLAEILHKPIAAVARLEAIALASGLDGNVLAALDAGRGEIFCGKYAISDGASGNAELTKARALAAEQLLTQAEFLALAAPHQVTTPDAKIAELCQEQGLRAGLIDSPRADLIASIGFAKITAGEVVSIEALDANYIRRSDAEIKMPSESQRP